MIERSKFTDYFAESSKKKSEDKPPRRGSRYERQRSARITVIQALFEANHHDRPLKTVARQYLDQNLKVHHHPIHPEPDLFRHLTETIDFHRELLDDLCKPLVSGHWSIETMDSLLKCILICGLAELMHPSKPTKHSILICEYVEITKGFYDDKEAGYINKALDEGFKTIEANLR